MDAWNTARTPGFGMSYFKRSDLPFYYALADAFTVGDQYFQSTFTPTNPNRLHQFSGSNGLSVNPNGTVIVDDSEPATGINWETLGETLEKAGISWKVYQEEDNFRTRYEPPPRRGRPYSPFNLRPFSPRKPKDL